MRKATITRDQYMAIHKAVVKALTELDINPYIVDQCACAASFAVDELAENEWQTSETDGVVVEIVD